MCQLNAKVSTLCLRFFLVLTCICILTLTYINNTVLATLQLCCFIKGKHPNRFLNIPLIELK